MAGKAAKKKKSFWKSREAKKAYWVFGAPALMILVWYGYILATEVGNAPKIDASINLDMFNLPEVAKKEGFKVADFNKCQNIVDEYTTPKGWNYSKEAVHQLVGLPATATQAQMNERCILYAKVINEMRKTSLHTRHVFVCGGSALDISGPGDFFIKPDPKGRGALQNMEKRAEGLLKISKGQSAVLRSWHVYNVGDGCLIVGLSKAGTFRMSASVSHGQ